MTDVQVPACAVQPTPFEEAAGHWRALRMAKTARPPVRGLRFQWTSVGGCAVERGDRGFVLGQEGGQIGCPVLGVAVREVRLIEPGIRLR